MNKPFALAAGLFMMVATTSGCHDMAVLWANMQGGDTVDAEYTLAKGPLLVLVDDRRGLVSEPRAIRELHETIADNFIRFDVNSRVIPYREVQRFQQNEPKYDKMSVREIGEKLGADQVIYVDVEKFTLFSEPGAPLFKGQFAVRVKVLTTERKAEVRLWPQQGKGKLVTAETPPTPTDGDKSASDIAAELGIKGGQQVAGLFYEHKEFDQ